MGATIKIKRRTTGSVGAPIALSSGELALNELDESLYYGKGDDGGGNATSIVVVGGKGKFVDLASAQTIAGVKTFSSSPIVPTPTNTGEAAPKSYVDSQVATTVVSFNGRSGPVTLTAADVPSLTAVKISDFDTQVRASRLDQLAAPTAAISLNSQKLINVAAPTASTDGANKAYVDAAIQGLNVKTSARVASAANVTIATPGTAIGGVTLTTGDRVLLMAQTTGSQNGLYVFNGSASAMTRTVDADTAGEVQSAFVFIEEGTSADNGFVMTTNAPITLGTTALTWTQFSGAGQVIDGAGLTKTGNQLDVATGAGLTITTDQVALTGQALALHNLATNGLITLTSSGVVAARSVAASGSGISVANGDGVAANPTVSLSAALSSVGGLTPAADRLAYYTGAGAAALATFTTYGRSLVDDVDAPTARTTLGLGAMATQAANAVAITGGTIDGVVFDGGTF